MPLTRSSLRRAVALAALALSLTACTPEGWIRFRFPDVPEQAIAVASCESGMDPRAVSPGGGNHGLFQLNNVHRASFEQVTGRPWSERYDAGANTLFARWLYEQSGWGPWTCQP